MQTKLHFSRFEFKYVLPPALRDEIERELGHFCQLDPYVEGKPHKRYMVRSLYYDDPQFTAYYDKINGAMHREKFRVRTYTGDPQERCATFLEVKGRHNALVFKHRVEFSEGERSAFETGEKMKPEVVLGRGQPGKVVDEFRFQTLRRRLRPVMLIDYQRRPYVSKYDAEFRLTFDESLQGLHTQSLYPTGRENPKRLLGGRTVMEVKFRHHLPSWFHRIIQAYELKRVSISKVCTGIEAWKLTPNLS